jgi:hypothetical protein
MTSEHMPMPGCCCENHLTAYLDGAELRGDPKGAAVPTIGRSNRRAYPNGAAACARAREAARDFSRWTW